MRTIELKQAKEEAEQANEMKSSALFELERAVLQKDLILHSASEGIYGLDPEGNLTFINHQGAKMLGYTPEELILQLQHLLIHYTKSDGSPCDEEEYPIHSSLRTGDTNCGINELFWKKDGTSLPVEYSSKPILEEGEITGAVVIFRDNTGRKSLAKG